MATPYHHRGISRMKAEELLTKVSEEGCFLIRDSETVPGAYVLCLLCQGVVHQYRILPTQDQKIAVQCEGGVNGPKFPDLQILVQEYMQRGERNGLICALKKPVFMDCHDDAEKDSDDDADDEVSSVAQASIGEPYKTTKSLLVDNFNLIDMSSFDGEFVDGLRAYMDSGIYKDAQLERSNSASHLLNLREVLKPSTAALTEELSSFLSKINACTQIFCGNEINRENQIISEDGNSNFNTLAMRLLVCATRLKDLQHKAEAVVKLVEPEPTTSGADLAIPPSIWGDSLRGTLNIPRATFEVKSIKHGRIVGVISLTVDIQAGKLLIVKPSKDVLDDSNTFTHDKILQLVKSTKDRSRLDVIIQGRKKHAFQFTDVHVRENFCQQILHLKKIYSTSHDLVKSTKDRSRLDVIIQGRKKHTFQFTDVHVRENFCQQILHLKNMHSTSTEVEQISVFIGTWNMGNAPPPWNLKAWLLGEGLGKTRSEVFDVIPHDLYVIGTQESSLTEKDWANTIRASLKDCFGMDMHIVEACNLWGIRLMVLSKPDLVHNISHVQHSSVRTGIANKLGNKGAVAISLQLNGTSMCFINCHLAAGTERSARRGQNFRDITKGLALGQKNLNIFDITHQFHHVFWFGDLNYRVDGDVHVTLAEAKQGNVAAMLDRDQLLRVQARKEAFVAYEEEAITFMPTYRLRRGIEVLDYDWKKLKKTGERINSPSWCDRILWNSYPGTYIENTSYGCAYKILTSDHRPVFGSFNLGITSQFVSPGRELSTAENSTTEIVFESVETEIKTCCSQYFYLEFYAPCLKAVVCSRSNKQFKSSDNRCNPLWSNNLLPKKMVPIFTERDYLEEQHILIAVRARDGDNESYGECVVALKDTFSATAIAFSCPLTHHGEETGYMKGRMHIVSEDNVKPRTSYKTYELVTMDTDPVYRDPEVSMANGPPGVDLDQSPKEPLTQTAPVEPALNGAHAEDQSEHTDLERRFSSPVPVESDSDEVYLEEGACAAPSIGNAASRARPRLLMGQSSLSQTQVLPVISPTTAASTKPTETPPVSQPTLSTASQPTTTTATTTTTAATSAIIPGPPVPSRWPDEGPDPSRQPAPPVPKRTKPPMEEAIVISNRRYVGLKRPPTVEDWLRGLGLPEYIPLFLSNGWDSMNYLGDLSNSDLDAMFIRDEKQREKIMESLKSLHIK